MATMPLGHGLGAVFTGGQAWRWLLRRFVSHRALHVTIRQVANMIIPDQAAGSPGPLTPAPYRARVSSRFMRSSGGGGPPVRYRSTRARGCRRASGSTGRPPWAGQEYHPGNRLLIAAL